MKKKMNKSLCLLLSCILCTSVIASCKNNGDSSSLNSDNQNSSSIEIKPSLGADTDIGKIVKTDKMIVSEGKTDYKILIPNNADGEIVTASNELKLLLNEATGVNLVSTSNYVKGDKYFSIGNTDLAEENGFTCTYEEVGFSGYKIKTIEFHLDFYI